MSEPEPRITLASLDFLRPPLPPDQQSILTRLNLSILEQCRAMPESLAGDTALLLQKHYTGFAPGNAGRLYTDAFYPSAWTILDWLAKRESPKRDRLDRGSKTSLQNIDEPELDRFFQIQAIVMFLHMFDDHLCDGDLPVDPLTLQFRSRLWSELEVLLKEFNDLETERVSTRLIDEYFRCTHRPPAVASLDEYCARFRGQMATWLIAPTLLALRIGDEEFAAQVARAYEDFGIAWRLLDDLRDCEKDAVARQESAVYFSLTPAGRVAWSSGHPSLRAILISENPFTLLLERIHALLEGAAESMSANGLPGPAGEYREMLRGLPRNLQATTDLFADSP